MALILLKGYLLKGKIMPSEREDYAVRREN